jgi:hypothetical protein
MITYKWEFPALYCAPLESGLADIVKIVRWRIIASEPKNLEHPESGNFYAVNIGGTALDPVTDTGSFTPFEQITTGIVAGWVSSKIDITGEHGIYSGLASEIERQKNPPIVRKFIGSTESLPV